MSSKKMDEKRPIGLEVLQWMTPNDPGVRGQGEALKL